MLINFTIRNFRSFSTLNSLSLESRSKTSDKPLRFAAIYGPNASGKSNILKALEYVRFATQNMDAVNKMTVSHPLLQPHMLNNTPAAPSFFELTFKEMSSDIIYRYGFEVDGRKIVSEWLIENADRGQRRTDRELFTREEQSIAFGPSVPKHIQLIADNVNEVVLALPYFANNNYAAALAVTNLVNGRFALFDTSNTDLLTQVAFDHMQKNSDLKERVLKVVQSFDTSINGIEIDSQILTQDQINKMAVPEQVRSLLSQATTTQVKTLHSKYDQDGKVVGSIAFDLRENESLGTQKLIPLVAMFLEAMEQGLVVVLDEFGSSLHPFFTKVLVDLFNSSDHDAQLIVITHETYLLNQELGLEAHQLWLVEKDRTEQSKLTSMIDYNPKGDARLDKQYLEGRFGAVPIIFEIEN